jgi:RNA polymerase sigma factor (sigma-70 family)
MPDEPSPAAPCAQMPPLPEGFNLLDGHPGIATDGKGRFLSCRKVGEVPTCPTKNIWHGTWREFKHRSLSHPCKNAHLRTVGGPPPAVPRIGPRPAGGTPRKPQSEPPALLPGFNRIADHPRLAGDGDGKFFFWSSRRNEWRRMPPSEVRKRVPAHLITPTKPRKALFPKPREERERMLADVDKMVRSIVTRAELSAEDREDFAQAARLELWEATEKWNPNGAARWPTYANVCITRVVARLKSAQRSRGEVHADDWDKMPDRPAERRASDLDSDDEEAEGETAAELFTAIQRVLTDGLLDAVTATHAGEATLSARRLVEAIAFDGLTVRDLAIQSGQPEKVVRANLKNAIRTLQRRGLTQHIMPDAKVDGVLVPNPTKNGQKKGSMRRRWQNHAPGGDDQEPACPVTPAGPQTAA